MALDFREMIGVAIAVYPARERLELLEHLGAWVDTQKRIARAQLGERPEPCSGVVDADFEVRR